MSFLTYRRRSVTTLVLTMLCVSPITSKAQSDPALETPGSYAEAPTHGDRPSTAENNCNWRDAERQIEYPALATNGHVMAGKALIHGTVTGNGNVVANFVETSDPAFNDAALAGMRQLICNLPPGTPINWPVEFMMEGESPALLSSISLPRTGTESVGDSRRVLVLLPQGIDPSNDHDGLNDLSRRLTSALAARLSEELQKRGIAVVGILDQRPVGIQEKLETYAGSLRARHIVVITVETVQANDEEELRYRIQYSDDDLIIKSGHLEAVLPSGTVARTYKIKGSKSGAAHASLESIALDFIKGLDDDNRLKSLAARAQ